MKTSFNNSKFYKFTRTALLPLSMIVAAGCAMTPLSSPSMTEGPIDLNDSIAVQKVEGLKNHWGGPSIGDPRAYYHFLMALKAEQTNRFEDAAAHYGSAAKFEPGKLLFHKKVITHKLRLGYLEDMIETCEAALANFPNDSELNMRMGDAQFVRGNHEAALNYYQRSYENNAHQYRAYLLRGIVFELLGQNSSAIEMFKQATLSSPFDTISAYHLGRAYMLQRNFEEAVQSLEKSVTLRPNFVQARDYLAWSLEQLGRIKEALNEYQMILKLDPANQAIRKRVAEMHERSNIFTRRLPDVDMMLSELVEAPFPFIKMGVIHYDRADYDKALEEFQWARGRSECKEILIILSRVFESMERIDLSIETFEILRRQSPPTVRTLLYLARLYNMNEQEEKAVELLAEAVAMEPDNDSLHHSLALANMTLKKIRSGHRQYEGSYPHQRR